MSTILLPTPSGADDTAALQAAINANPANTVFEGDGKPYKVASILFLPAGTQFLTLRNARITVLGDVGLLDVVAGAVATFLRLENLYIEAQGHTTKGRKLINYSRMAQARFSDVWTNGTLNKTIHFYANGNGGSASYYNKWEGCYMGNMYGGIWAEDGAPAMTANSNMITGCRIQPMTGNFGLYLGANSQQFTVIGNQFESPGGSVYVDGQGHSITSNRFEGVNTLVSGTATGNTIMSNYRSGSSVNWGGSSSANNYHPYAA